MERNQGFFLEFQKTGWRIWYFQNVLLIIPLILFIPNYFSKSGVGEVNVFGAIINIFFYIALILDLLSVLLISISIVIEYYSRKKENYSLLILFIPFLGFLWVLLGLFWRLPFYSQGPFDFGFGFRRSIRPSNTSIYSNLIYDPLIVVLLISGSFLLFLFLFLQDNFLLFGQSPEPKRLISINIGAFFGLANCFSNFLLLIIMISGLDLDYAHNTALLFFSPSMGLLLLICLISQLLVVPLLGMRTARKYISCMGKKTPLVEHSSSISNSKESNIKWFQNTLKTCEAVSLRPSKRISGILIIGIILLFFLPFSPFFHRKVFPSPYVEGPYITRTTSKENMWILQHVETLPLYKMTGLKSSSFLRNDYILMTNSTMNLFLKKINRGTSIPYYYHFKWMVSLIESESSVMNSSVFSSSWQKITKGGPFIVIWWDIGTRFIYDELRDLTDFRENGTEIVENTSRLMESRLEIKWIFLGSYQYDEISGPVAGHFIKGYQLLFLNEKLDLVCFAFYQIHVVS